MLSEFIERTGFTPTTDEYAQIEAAYYAFDGDKDAFCKAFVEQGGEQEIHKAQSEEIRRLRAQALELKKKHEQDLAERDRCISSLQAELDKELDWQPASSADTNTEQADYEHLARAGRAMSDQEAIELIADECGFDPEKIRIIHKANSYEVNKYHRLRVAAEYERIPVYESTDWNYVRFDCALFMYEFINGQLYFYCR